MDCSDQTNFGSPLLVRPAPIEGESWGGYLLRLSEANHLGNIANLGNVVGMSLLRLIAERPSSVLPRLGISWNASASEARAKAPNENGRFRVATAGRSVRSRVCPKCLVSDEEPYIRAEWDLPLSISCDSHGVMLIDTCPKCGKAIDFSRSHIAQCNCGCSFGSLSGPEIGGWTRSLKKVFAEAYADRIEETFASAGSLERTAARVCFWLVAPVDSRTNRRQSHVQDRACFVTQATISAMQPILSQWPRSAAEAVGAEVRSSAAKQYVALSKRLHVWQFRAMRSILSELKRRPSVAAKVALAVSARQLSKLSCDSYGIGDLTRVTGHSYRGLVATIEKGLIPGATYRVNAKNGRKQFDIPADIFRSIEKAFCETTNVRYAAILLGCSEHAIRGLAHSKVITTQPFLASGFSKRLCPGELARMAEYLFRHSIKRSKRGSPKRVYFSAWVPGPFKDQRAWRWKVVIEAIRSRTLALYSAADVPVTLNDLFVYEADLARVMSR